MRRLILLCRRTPVCGLMAAALLLLLSTAHASPLAPDALREDDPQTAEHAPHQEHQETETNPARRLAAWMLITQRQLHRDLTSGMRDLRHEASATNGLWLILISFLYGMFHAAGPGHGKAVISTYLLTHRARVRRGLTLSFAASFLQAVTAIVLVFGLVRLAGWLSRDAMQQVATVELVSFGLVATLGALLCVRACRGLLRRPVPVHHQHPHDDGPMVPVTAGLSPSPHTGGGAPDTPQAGHHPTAGCACGHAHHVAPDAVAPGQGRWPMIATVLAVGIRPCTGAVLILVAANLLGLWTAGLFAVFAMALGTALTVSALAVLAIKARSWAVRIASRGGAARWTRAGDVAALAGGLLILFAGLSLFSAALTTAPPAFYRL
ncbi:MAG: nickel/cobalt transporter [Ectothiorhodospiraceae bacterium]|nr:nickel/cobalt transporter [Ectothiorhodospiraceae bacterium]